MDILLENQNNHDKSAVFQRFLALICPQQAQAISPMMNRLLHAQQMGESFIYLNKQEKIQAENADKLVGGAYSFQPFTLSQNRLFITKIYQLEHNIAKRIAQFAPSTTTTVDSHAEVLLNALFSGTNDQEQKAAAQKALYQPFLLISGGPGTGKTTTVAKILALLCQIHYSKQAARIALSAPTGKAAAHLQASLNRALNTFDTSDHIRQQLQSVQGSTLHRLLSITPPSMRAKYHQQKQLPYDIVVIDEASMMDLSMTAQLLDALPSQSRLILLGDAHQLPSVGMGKVLASLIDAADNQQKRLPETANPPLAHAELKTSHRFGANSGIGNLARAVKNADATQALAYFSQYPEEIMLLDKTANIYHQYYQSQSAYWQSIEQKDIQLAFEHFYDSIMLCVLQTDSQTFNQGYLKYLQQQGYHGDFFDGFPIMITRNNPTNGLYNGDIGIMLNQGNGYEVFFPEKDGFLNISVARLAEYTPAFSLTVHKSQGSEYNAVYLLSPSVANAPIFDRTLLYTALTRAKKYFTYLGSADTFQAALKHKNQRNSALAERIAQQGY